MRISGRDPERLSIAARHAAEAGLEVWFSPFPADLRLEQVLPLFADCAQRAEALCQGGAQVVFVTGCELSVFGHGALPGGTYLDRLHAMASAARASSTAWPGSRNHPGRGRPGGLPH